MRVDQRLVTEIPLAGLWNDEGLVNATRGRHLARAAVAARLRSGPVAFAIADVGRQLRWIPPRQAFNTWTVIRDWVVDPDASYENDGMLRYRASEWSGPTTGPIILFEALH